MSESHDPLRSVFKEAAAVGQSRARSAPPSFITERGERARRRRIVALAVGACLVFSGTGAAVASLVPDSTGTTVPATTPSPVPSPRLSPSPSSPNSPNPTSSSPSSPSSPRISLPPSHTPSSGQSSSSTPTESPSTSPATPSGSVTLPPP
ncbi:hypothetical protein OG978_21395 [Streptomyces sp. NBC_01591]|uniref:hypothetical protein n=1 Tax=Streptomyces sp. NBC_01591 TaxID=2975888 RepID=UPI002DD9E0FA|nr:hypothetical protein [Streptomyces sp. NBC_01591]WSD69712.1 hypothetical protein OG978_21395 [Streptomyces sp. NBC_01591]